VPFDRVQGEEKPLTNLMIRESLGNTLQYFQLALAQCIKHFGLWIFDFRLRHGRRLCKCSQEFIYVTEQFMILAARLLFNRQSKIRNRHSHWLAFVNKDTDEAVRLCQSQCVAQQLHSLVLFAMRMKRDRLENNHLEPFILTTLGFHLPAQWRKQSHRCGRVSLGQEYPNPADG